MPTRNPDRCPTHSGELLREEVLSAVKQPKTRIAAGLDISRQHLHDILAERKPVTPEMAVRLAKMFGSTLETWVGFQAAHDVWHAERRVDVSGIPTPPAAK